VTDKAASCEERLAAAHAAAAAAKAQATEAATVKSADAAVGSDSSGGGGKVEVGFFGESLCPDCQHMVQDVLAPLFANGVADLMSLR
jgi:uncharacterized protein (DUF2147 family)